MGLHCWVCIQVIGRRIVETLASNDQHSICCVQVTSINVVGNEMTHILAVILSLLLYVFIYQKWTVYTAF